MSLILVRPENLEKLPEDARLAVASLNKDQLRLLFEAFALDRHFDFLKLPLEIRWMVYRLMFTSQTGFIRITSTRGQRDHLLVGLNLLAVNRQIYAEAMQILQEEDACKLDSGCTLTATNKIMMLRLSKYKLNFRLGWNWPTDAYFRKTREGRAWTRIFDELATNSFITNVQVHVSCGNSRVLGKSVPPNMAHHFMRAQFEHIASDLLDRLKIKSPDVEVALSLSSDQNVPKDINLKVQRISSQAVNIAHTTQGWYGCVELGTWCDDAHWRANRLRN